MAIGTAIAIATGLAIGAATAIGVSSASRKPEQPKAPALPAPPSPQAAEDAGAEAARRKKVAVASAGKTMYTSPLGSAGEASIAKKTLLGQ